MVDKIIFPSGSAQISKEGKKVLNKVIDILKDVKDKRIQVEGHTDNVPIVSSLKKRFPTNWELSTGRATEVVRYLQEAGGLDAKLLSATGYSEYQPVASNESETGKRKNRRIEIVLLPLLK
jgi:chemotaxis protein MotB